MSYLQPTRLVLDEHLPGSSSSQSAPEITHETAAAAQSPPASIGISIPQSGSVLGELSQDEYNLEESGALSLGFSVATLMPSGSHDVLIFQAARYEDVAIKGETYRFGVAIEATIVVTTEKFQGGLTLPVVAANVQLSHATASSNLAVRGYLPQAPLHLPGWGSFDVGSYSDFQNTVSELQDSVLFDNANIHPVLLATTQPAKGSPQGEPTHGFFYNLGERIKRW